jgi:hypothetical protein
VLRIQKEAVPEIRKVLKQKRLQKKRHQPKKPLLLVVEVAINPVLEAPKRKRLLLQAVEVVASNGAVAL